MRLLVTVLAVLVGGSTAQHYYAQAPLRPVAPYHYSQERVVTQGRITTGPAVAVTYDTDDRYEVDNSYYPSSGGNPCSPSPCGPNTRCTTSRRTGIAQCRCVEGYVPDGNTINGCKPQCVSDDECPDDYRCQAMKCVRVCQSGACGLNADCDARNHRPLCRCPDSHTGDPHIRCSIEEPEERVQPPAPYVSPCQRNPCGTNAECKVKNERAVCTCPFGYEGDPLTHCIRGECTSPDDCPGHQTCQKLRCINPCSVPGMCADNAECKTRNHQPVCSCPRGYTGDPLVNCRRFDPQELCNPSPCGENTNCKVRNGRAVCSCFQNYIGNPLTSCRPECERDSDCPHDKHCSQNLCRYVCREGACGEGAHCVARNNRAVCSCPQDFLGSPHTRCYTECTQHDDCSSHQACLKFRCVDPCVGACGHAANCVVKQHAPICSCPKSMTGDPFVSCRDFTDADYCASNPCGVNADCQVGFDRSNEKRAVCTCPVGYIGNPLQHCERGECQTNSDCSRSQACHLYRCINPCYHDQESVCGENANCHVKNHQPVCSCAQGYSGDALRSCFVSFAEDRYIAGRS